MTPKKCSNCSHGKAAPEVMQMAYHPIKVVECSAFQIPTRSILAADHRCRFQPSRWQAIEEKAEVAA